MSSINDIMKKRWEAGLMVYTGNGRVERRFNFNEEKVMDLRPPESLSDTFESAIEKFRLRDSRRHLLQQAAMQMIGQIIDEIEDSEGWNCAKREEWYKNAKRKG